MATPNGTFIAATLNDVKQMLDLIEQAQAIAAARAAEWLALQNGPFLVLEEGDFEQYAFTMAQFADVQTALNAVPNILGGWGTVYYRVKN